MLVTVEFIAHGTSTELILMQHGFAGDDLAPSYDAGWQSGLDKLGIYLARRAAET